jgi:hypothetical protein
MVLDWLLEDENPGVRVRAHTELYGLPDNDPQVIASRGLVMQTLDAATDLSWMGGEGIRLIYNLTALAESGLTRKDVRIDPVVDRLLSIPFDANCGDFMLLRALTMLGYGADERIRERLSRAAETQLPDGAWMCLHRLDKMNRTPKSCMKAAMHGLLMAGEMTKRDMVFPGTDQLIHYFTKRRLFYRTDDPIRMVLHSRPGARMTDAYFPIELMRVGLPMLLEALAVLGAGQSPELDEAWSLLESKQDEQGRTKLEGTLPKSYLPKERVGKASKWMTLYAMLAFQAADKG